jgi:hypothetical protein
MTEMRCQEISSVALKMIKMALSHWQGDASRVDSQLTSRHPRAKETWRPIPKNMVLRKNENSRTEASWFFAFKPIDNLGWLHKIWRISRILLANPIFIPIFNPSKPNPSIDDGFLFSGVSSRSKEMDVYTSLVLLALTSSVSAIDAAPSPSWNRDYALARKQGESEKKPLVVIVASGQDGWNKLAHDGSLSDEAKSIPTIQYVCLYVDTATEDGKRLAREFEISDALGIVISDRTGNRQAFRHEGDLANRDLSRYLRRYADPDRVVHVTETNPAEPTRVSSPQSGSIMEAPCVT